MREPISYPFLGRPLYPRLRKQRRCCFLRANASFVLHTDPFTFFSAFELAPFWRCNTYSSFIFHYPLLFSSTLSVLLGSEEVDSQSIFGNLYFCLILRGQLSHLLYPSLFPHTGESGTRHSKKLAPRHLYYVTQRRYKFNNKDKIMMNCSLSSTADFFRKPRLADTRTWSRYKKIRSRVLKTNKLKTLVEYQST